MTTHTTTFRITGADREPILGDVHLPDGAVIATPPPVVVVLHGFKGFKDWGMFPHIAQALADAGFAAVRFNTSHNGVGEDLVDFSALDKFARNTFGRELFDVAAVLDALAAGRLTEGLAAPSAGVTLLGHSRGGGVAHLIARERPDVARVVSLNAIASVHRYDAATLEQWKRDGRLVIPNARTGQDMPLDYEIVEEVAADPDRFDIRSAVREREIPRLIIHGEDDPTVPIADGEALAEAAGAHGQFERIPGADHTFGAGHPWQGWTEPLRAALDRTREFLGDPRASA